MGPLALTLWILAGCIAAIFSVVVGRALYRLLPKRSLCPYDSAPLTDVSSEPFFDIFMSYKSEDAPFARMVVDRLLAIGCRVWFAEYCIRSLAEFDTFNDRIAC